MILFFSINILLFLLNNHIDTAFAICPVIGPITLNTGQTKVITGHGWCELCNCTIAGTYLCENRTKCDYFKCSEDAAYFIKRCCEALNCNLEYTLAPSRPRLPLFPYHPEAPTGGRTSPDKTLPDTGPRPYPPGFYPNVNGRKPLVTTAEVAPPGVTSSVNYLSSPTTYPPGNSVGRLPPGYIPKKPGGHPSGGVSHKYPPGNPFDHLPPGHVPRKPSSTLRIYSSISSHNYPSHNLPDGHTPDEHQPVDILTTMIIKTYEMTINIEKMSTRLPVLPIIFIVVLSIINIIVIIIIIIKKTRHTSFRIASYRNRKFYRVKYSQAHRSR